MIVLTGGAGFIGSCLLATLNASGHKDVLIVDSLGSSGEKWKNLVGKTFIDIVSKEDFRDQMLVGDVGDVSAVIHMGACSATTETDADYLYDNNTKYSIDVAEFALERGARFIYASSAATYGNGERGYDDATVDLEPMNMYGFSKHLFDLWIRRNGHTDRCVGLKFFNVFGPNEYHKGSMSSMVYKAVNQINENGQIQLFKTNDPTFADGGQMRDFVYVKDCCTIVMDLLERPSVNGIFNVGTGTARTWNDLAMAVFAAIGREPNISYVDMPEHLRGQYQNYTQADMSSLRACLPSASFRSLEDSIADYVQRHLLQERRTY